MRSAALAASAVTAVLVLTSAASAQLATLLKDIDLTGNGSNSAPVFLGAASGVTYFSARSSSAGWDLWSSDGTPERTSIRPEACSNPCDKYFESLGGTEDRLFLARSTSQYPGTTFALLEASDNPPQIRTLFEATQDFYLNELPRYGSSALLGSVLVFPASHADSSTVLLATNGESGALSELRTFEPYASIYRLQRVGDALYFWLSVSGMPHQLWVTDGTSSGTRHIVDLELDYVQRTVAIGENILGFSAADADGLEFWSSDGTAEGTRKLTDLIDPSAKIGDLKRSSSHALFLVGDVTFGQELWSSDGTPSGTHAVTSFGYHQPFGHYLEDSPLLVVNDRVWFYATDGVATTYLWSATAVAGSAQQFIETCPYSDCFEGNWLTSIGSQIFFLRANSGFVGEPWTSDGSAAGTHPLLDGCSGPCASGASLLSADGGRLALSATVEFSPSLSIFLAQAPWIGATLLFDPLRGGPTLRYVDQASSTTVGQLTFFGARSAYLETLDPWVSGGSIATTQLLTHVSPATDLSSSPRDFSLSGSTVAFLASDDYATNRLWLSDGTTATTRPVSGDEYYCYGNSDQRVLEALADRFVTKKCYGELATVSTATGLSTVLASTGCSQAPASGTVQGKVVVALRGCSGNTEVWRTDGTVAATSRTFVFPGSTDIASDFTAVNDRLLFTGRQSENSLYAFNSTFSAIQALTPPNVFPDSLLAPEDQGIAFFTHGGVLWRTDGSPAGTIALPLGPESRSLAAATRSPAGYDLLLFHYPGVYEIWSSNGSLAGTFLRSTVVSGEANLQQAIPLARAGASLFFDLPDYPNRPALWVLPDDAGEARRLQEMEFPHYFERELVLAPLDNRIVFVGCDTDHGCELWVSDGSSEGTRLLQDIAPGPHSSHPSGFSRAGDDLYFVADDDLHASEPWILKLAPGQSCVPTAQTLCLESGRFQVASTWRDFAGNSGDATAVAITGDTGYFWFFDEDNVELILKLIDGGGFNGHHWVYYGALSNVEYTFTVTDSETGAAKRYFNPATRFASSGDITAFGPQGAHALGGEAEAMTRAATPPEVALADSSVPQGLPGACVPTATRFCILNNRFAVTATWRDFAGHTGTANAGTLTDDTGYLWFFNEDNVEVVLKMVDAGAFNQHFWVYYGALSNVEYTLTVTDTVGGGPPRIYHNALGQFGSFGDVEAFPAP